MLCGINALRGIDMAKVTIELSIEDFKRLADYLITHEYDIAAKINDFADLRGLFVAVYESEPVDD